ncbi:hypothetical protein BDN70DRAFT_881435 [Pholiota conissans]|uniref:Uncharacterized protein n=1 Tax=Pholiota conissans TaxID=109636 RepID=A0A9P5Z035_9AGAR|nr:hypothetical protein BDN70DRAFT_881435 [Pholiota conissans]
MVHIIRSLFALTASLAALKQVQAGDSVTIFQPVVPTFPITFLPFPGPNGPNAPKVIGVAPIAVENGVVTQYEATEVITAFSAGGTTVTFEPTTIVVTFEEGLSTYHAVQATTTTINGHAIALSEDINCGAFNYSSPDLNCTNEGVASIEGSVTRTGVVHGIAPPSAIFTITSPSPNSLPIVKNGASNTASFMVAASFFVSLISGIALIL